MPKTDKSRLDSPTVYGTLRNVDFSAAGGGRRTAAEIKEWPSFKTYEKMRSIFFRLKDILLSALSKANEEHAFEAPCRLG